MPKAALVGPVELRRLDSIAAVLPCPLEAAHRRLEPAGRSLLTKAKPLAETAPANRKCGVSDQLSCCGTGHALKGSQYL